MLLKTWWNRVIKMAEDKIRKRLTIDRELNEQVKSMAKKRSVSSDIFIEEAIKFYITYEQDHTNHDNIYTNRINELTLQLELIRNESASMNRAILNRLDTILEYQNPTTYL